MNQSAVLAGAYGAPLLAAALALGLGVAAHRLIMALLRRLARKSASPLDDAALAHLSAPARSFCLLAALGVGLSLFPLPSPARAWVEHGLSLAWIAALAWALMASTWILEAVLRRRYDLGAKDNLVARKVLTQYKVLQRIVFVLVFILSAAAMLMTFDAFRELGVSILASAGVAGIVVGLAAQKTLAAVLAGVQIAVTQPVRIDDVVIVEGEWGRVEEITFTYVVVRIWDQRRLVVPVTWFLERPFQNWTRKSSEIMGTVFVHADFRLPVAEVRAELERICRQEAGDLWDGRVCGLQVTDLNDSTMVLRALVSAADASKCWDLRCLVRERLVDFLQREHPGSLPLGRRRLLSEG
ncbi:MAG: mechanosensitive ion channel family protein [Desulfovibrionaceae bacterium]|nr:mechanosensitive ion channel family protein [Desulfovibrionaceae bacterium]